MKQLLTIIPTYNEAENIQKIISEIFVVAQNLDGWLVSILIVDDNSPDGTADIVRTLQTTVGAQRLQMISGKKAGLGKAYMRGFEDGLRQDVYDVFIMMDADFSHDPHAMPGLLQAIDEGADYVIGSRYVHGGSIPGNWPLMRIINSRVANFVAHFFTDMDKGIADVTGGYKAIRTSALKKIDLQSINAAGYVFQVSLLHEFARRSAVIKEVPITFIDRQYGNSKMKARDILEFIYRAYKLNPESRISRLLRFGLVGACGSVVNIVVLTLLVHFSHLSVFVAVAIAIEVSIISNFFMNHYYTFKLRAMPARQSETSSRLIIKLIKFNIGALGGALISFLTFSLLHKELHVQYVIADLLAIVLAMGWNYWMSTKVVWKLVDART